MHWIESSQVESGRRTGQCKCFQFADDDVDDVYDRSAVLVDDEERSEKEKKKKKKQNLIVFRIIYFCSRCLLLLVCVGLAWRSIIDTSRE